MSTAQLIQNRYQLQSVLGEGGMGVVYRAYDRLEKQDVALKQVLLPTSDLSFASKPGTDDSDKLRLGLAREFRILASLRHPHILSVLDYGFDANANPFYTMTLLADGVDIVTFAAKQPDDVKFGLIVQLLQALHYLHRRGVLHRDLKPGNVFVTAEGQVKVMDFGLAKVDAQSVESSNDGDMVGTLSYMAPELFQGGTTSVASDLWAVGVMAHEILSGYVPFDSTNIATMIAQILFDAIDLSDLPPVIATWLGRLLEKDPKQRSTTAYDAMHALFLARDLPLPQETEAIRESFLQASSFVGREAEITQLTDALAAIETQNAFFLIGGESGVGKSRLLEELRVQALVNDVVVLRGQAVEGGGLPFQVWRNIVRRLLLLSNPTDFQAAILKDLVPDAGELLGRDVPDAPELTGHAYQERIALTTVELLRALQRPLLIQLEDLQWATESLALLQQILKVRDQLPRLMIVANYRDDEAPQLIDTLPEMTLIKLQRLEPDAISALSTAMLGDVGADDAVIQLLQTESEGNTLFVIETVRSLAEISGSLQQIGSDTLPASVFTGGMQAIMRRRISRVNPRYREIQTLAAIIGREIDTRLLEHAFDAASLQSWLNNAADYGVVDVQDNVWRFAHDKLRETILADMDEVTAQAKHRQAAETIEAVFPDDHAYNEVLLEHWQQADNTDKIYPYVLLVAKNKLDITGEYASAEALLQAMLNRLPEDDTRCVVLWNQLASSTAKRGDYNSSQQSAHRAQQLATVHHDQNGLALSLENLGLIAYHRGDYDRASELFQQSLSIFQQLGDQHGVAINLQCMGNVAFLQGNYARADEFYQQSLSIKRQLSDQRGIAQSLGNLGNVAFLQGEYTHASELHQQSLSIKRQLGDQAGIAHSLIKLGIIAVHQQDYAHAVDFYQQSLSIRQRLGDQPGIAESLHNLGHLAYQQGDYDRAMQLFLKTLHIKQQLGDRAGIAHSFHNLGGVAHQQGEHARATQLFLQSLAIRQQLNVVPLVLLSMVGVAMSLLPQGYRTRAGQLVGLAMHHPAQNATVSEALEEFKPVLQAALSPDKLQAAFEHGKQSDLDSVVVELLAEFGDTEDDKQTVTTTSYTTNQPQLNTVIASAVAIFNATTSDDGDPPMSTEMAYATLSAAKLAELKQKIAAKLAEDVGENTVNLQTVIDEVVVLLREAQGH